MKPRTKMQVDVIQLSKYLRLREKELLPWAIKECLEHKGFQTKSKVICMDCGLEFSPGLISRNRAVCPHCNTKLKIEQSRKRTYKQLVYFAIAEIYEEYQLIRNFELSSIHKYGTKAKYNCREILQHWILPTGKREVVGLNHTVNWYYDSWNGKMEIRDKSNTQRYDVYPYKYHPDSVFKSTYKFYGINHNLEGITFLEAIKLIPDNPKAETLLKAKQYGLLKQCNERHGILSSHWTAIKICMRNKYKVKDAQMYLDYLNLLQYFGKDLHNAYYVCPKNLKKVHDKLVIKKRRKQEQESTESKRQKALQDEITFKKLKSAFFGIAFSDGEIDIHVLESIKEYMEEGDTLKHCVFTNEYYLKPDTLIMSASIAGQKLETIEISIKDLKVVQCRGKSNDNTKYHNRIIELVNKNMHLIESRTILHKNNQKTAAA